MRGYAFRRTARVAVLERSCGRSRRSLPRLSVRAAANRQLEQYLDYLECDRDQVSAGVADPSYGPPEPASTFEDYQLKTGLITFVLLASIYSSVLANVGVFGGSGRTIELSNSEQVQLVSEEVTIAPLLGLKAEADQVEYRCRFVLKNLSPTAVKVQVGFPLDGGLHSERGIDEADQVLSHHFIARDEHDTYHVRYRHQEPPAKYRELLMWDMAFSPLEEKVLRVGYILPMSVAVATTANQKEGPSENSAPRYGRPWYAMLEPCVFEQLTYITETGNSWKVPIEKATFNIANDGTSFWMSRRSEFFLAAVDPPLGGSEPQRLYRMKVGLTYLQQSAGDWKHDSENGCMTWNIRNYKPGTPIRFSWFGTCLPGEAGECDSIVRQLMGTHPQEAEVLELSEIVGAFYGMAPKTDLVKKFVKRQVWYHPKDGLRRSELTDEQRATLTRLEVIAKEGLKASAVISEE